LRDTLWFLTLLLLLIGLHGCLWLLLCGIEWLHSTNDLGRTLTPQSIQFGAQEPVVVVVEIVGVIVVVWCYVVENLLNMLQLWL